jgi:hypothetical protein
LLLKGFRFLAADRDPFGGANMSLEVYALSNQRLPSSSEWQLAIEAEGFPLRLVPSLPILDFSGTIPCQLRTTNTGFEYANLSPADFEDETSARPVAESYSNIVVLRWGADLPAGAAAYMAAAAYARATGGIVFDGEEGELLSVDRAAEIAREMERRIPIIKRRAEQFLEDLKTRTER